MSQRPKRSLASPLVCIQTFTSSLSMSDLFGCGLGGHGLSFDSVFGCNLCELVFLAGLAAYSLTIGVRDELLCFDSNQVVISKQKRWISMEYVPILRLYALNTYHHTAAYYAGIAHLGNPGPERRNSCEGDKAEYFDMVGGSLGYRCGSLAGRWKKRGTEGGG